MSLRVPKTIYMYMGVGVIRIYAIMLPSSDFSVTHCVIAGHYR